MASNRIVAAAHVAALAALAVLSAGCTFVPVEPEPTPALKTALDPCASRLHDVAGTLLLYCATHDNLPADLSGVKQAAGDTCPPLECPVSGKPYQYFPTGLEIPGLPGLVVLSDSTACHEGSKWGLVASQIGPGKSLQFQVLLLPAGAIPALPAPGGGDPARK